MSIDKAILTWECFLKFIRKWRKVKEEEEGRSSSICSPHVFSKMYCDLTQLCLETSNVYFVGGTMLGEF